MWQREQSMNRRNLLKGLFGGAAIAVTGVSLARDKTPVSPVGDVDQFDLRFTQDASKAVQWPAEAIEWPPPPGSVRRSITTRVFPGRVVLACSANMFTDLHFAAIAGNLPYVRAVNFGTKPQQIEFTPLYARLPPYTGATIAFSFHEHWTYRNNTNRTMRVRYTKRGKL
jgi:hypothetical protein